MHQLIIQICVVLVLQDAPSSPEARLQALLPGLSSSDQGKLEAAWTELERLCLQAGRPGAEAERKAVASAIAARLAGELPIPAKAVLLRALETVGKAEVVPELAKLIAPGNDPAVREGARRALEANPHVNAKRELRSALHQADGALRVGIIRSLGVRRDFLATADLISLAEEPEPSIRMAALEALAEIGDISAVPVAEKALSELKGPERAAAERAYLRLADSLVRNGERGQARRIYDKAAGISPAMKAAALVGFARAGLQSEVGRIVEALSDANPAVRGAAREAAAILPGDAMTKALVEKAKAGADSGTLQVLARRGGEAARDAILDAARSARDDAARAHAIRLLADVASGQDSPPGIGLILEALGSPGELGEAAEEALRRLATPAAVAVELSKASGARKLALIRVLGAFREADGRKPLESAAEGAPAEVRTAVWKALGQIGDEASAEVLLGALSTTKDAELASAEAALARLGVGAARRIADALASAKGPARAAILRVMGQRQDPGALDVLKAAARESDPLIRAAAIDGLARSPDPAVLPILLEAAEKGSGEVQRAAVRGCLRFAAELGKGSREQAARIYLFALDQASSDEDLRVALRGAAETAGPESLEKILRHLKPGAVQRDAGRAALRLAERLPEDKQAGARSIYEKVLESDPDNATATQCVRRLRRLGVNVDFARKQGFVTRWWILAPIPNPQGSLWEKALPPESGVDVARPVEHEGKQLAWKPYHTPSPRGLVDLDEAGYGSPAAGAYLYAEVTSQEARDVLLKLGSDDQIACWLNGVKVHAHPTSRGLEVDQDTVKARLAPGVNRILLKVLNDGGGWGACLRITASDGKPLELPQKGD